ncbi:MAG TPA: xylulokinase [Candidatus Sumerlaeota bacterium]|nr:xylulokinase [Candidatus Sumerlaeota bacterium]
MFFVGIDSGTQSTRAILVSGATGRILASAAQTTPLLEGLPPGHKEQNPDDWFRAMMLAIKEVIRKAGIPRGDIRGIGISGQQHGFVPLDEAGRVIRPAKLWCDTSTSAQCERILDRIGGLERCIELTGNGIPAGFTASKILWLKENEPENYRKLKTVLLPHDYLNFRLTGRAVMEWGDASGTALMDVRNRTWRREIIEAIDPDLMNLLPPIIPSWEAAGRLLPDIAAELGLSPDVLVSAGGGDNMMGAIGTGNVRPGIVTASLGTSGTIYACNETPVVDPRGEIAAFCDSTGQWLPLLCVMNVTVSTELTRALFEWNIPRLDAAIAETEPGAGGLTLLPWFEGERTPNVPEGTGVWFGLNSRTMRPANMARAAMEGATMSMNYGLNRLRSLGLKASEIRMIGGGSKSPAWRQIAADVFDAEVVCMADSEGAALGAALQARWSLGREEDQSCSLAELAETWVRVDESTRTAPKQENIRLYRDLQGIQDELSERLRPLFKKHRSFIAD